MAPGLAPERDFSPDPGFLVLSVGQLQAQDCRGQRVGEWDKIAHNLEVQTELASLHLVILRYPDC